MAQCWWPAGQPVTTRAVARIANVISAGRSHFDCVTAMIRLRTVFFIFITLFFFPLVEFLFVVAANVPFANSFLVTVAVLVHANVTHSSIQTWPPA
jgi:hypothetical protein